MALEGSERKALHAILHEEGGSQAGYVDDSKIAEIAHLPIEEVRDCLETLEAKECVERSPVVGGCTRPYHGERPTGTQTVAGHHR